MLYLKIKYLMVCILKSTKYGYWGSRRRRVVKTTIKSKSIVDKLFESKCDRVLLVSIINSKVICKKKEASGGLFTSIVSIFIIIYHLFLTFHELH